MNSKYLLPLVDGGIIEIHSDSDWYGGCETCDYGSCYWNEYLIDMSTGTLHVKASKMYSHPLSEDYMMKLFLSNIEEIKKMTEQEFRLWFKDKMDKFVLDNSWYVSLCDLEVKFDWRGKDAN